VGAVFRRFWPDARPYRGWLALGLLIALVIPLVEAAEVWMFKLVVDDVLVPRDLGPLAWIAALTAGIVATRGLLTFTDHYLGAWVGERFVLDLRTRVFGHVQGLTPDTLERRRMGDTLTRVTSDVDHVEGIVVSGAADFASSTVRILVFGGILFYLDPLLATITVVTAPFLWVVAARFSRRIRSATRTSRRHTAALTALSEESLANAALVQAYGRERDETERFHAQGEGLVRAEMRAARIRALFTPIVDMIELSAALLVIGMGTWAVAEGRLTLGGLLVFLTYVTQLYGPVRELGSWATAMFSAAAAAERVIDVLNEEPAVREAADAPAHDRLRGDVTLRDVTFTYPGAASPTLRHADLTIAAGEVVALVGDNGTGKSTLAKLLLRFHDPDSGTVRLDDVDVRTMRIADVRRNVTVLLQETLIFHGTVRENLLLARPEADDAALWTALDAAGAASFVRRLPDGLDSVLGQRGRTLSGGQRQMIAIARALLRDAPVLVLDEPTTGLDAGARARLRGPLRTLLTGRTTIVISHDDEMTSIADRVIRLSDGALVDATPPAAVR